MCPRDIGVLRQPDIKRVYPRDIGVLRQPGYKTSVSKGYWSIETTRI